MKKLLLVLLCWLIAVQCFAQDPHFTQYFASPLSLNPANTGFFDGSFRLAVHERQQSLNFGSVATYSTTSISGDLKILHGYLPDDDILAVGVDGLFDRSLNGALNSNYFSGSAAYHKSLAANGSHMLTLGVQYTFANINLDYSKLSFASQFNGDIFDTSIPVNLNNINSFTNYSDFHAGLLYSAHLKNINFYTGVSLYHILRPAESLYNTDSKLPYRKTVHAGADLKISETSSLLFSGLYMGQSTARDEMAGVAYGLKRPAGDNNGLNLNLYLGMWYRRGDTFIPYIGAEIQNISVGLNYEATNGQNTYRPSTFELSLIFKTKQPLSPRCPKF